MDTQSDSQVKKDQHQTSNRPNDLSRLQYRPLASDGWWLGYLIFAAYLVNCWKFDRSLTFEYKFSATISFGMVLQTEFTHHKSKIGNPTLRYVICSVPAIATCSLFMFLLDQGLIFSAFCGVVSVLSYHALFVFSLRQMPKSFTCGEASIVVQGIVIFLANLYFKLITMLQKTTECLKTDDNLSCVLSTKSAFTQSYMHHTEMEQLATILHIGFLGVTFLIGCCYFIRLFRGLMFYGLLIAVGLVVIAFPIDDQPAIFVLIEFLTQDQKKLCMMLLYIVFIGVSVSAVVWLANRKQKSNTRTRKIFHILMALFFIPSLIYQCSFLYFTSGVPLALFIVLETMRVIKLPPIHNELERSVKYLIDEKDAGFVAMTPIYLLVGCALPLWLHPSPCDLTDSAGFELVPLMAGVISVGVGDTAASVVGSLYGRIKWSSEGKKTVEGTMAAVFVQACILPLLIHFGLVRYSGFLVTKYLVAVTANSFIETFTDQVDNLVLPLVTFILLSL